MAVAVAVAVDQLLYLGAGGAGELYWLLLLFVVLPRTSATRGGACVASGARIEGRRNQRRPKLFSSRFSASIKLESRGDVSSACVRYLYHIVDYSILSIVLCS